MKNVTVLTEDEAFALFFRPHPGGFDSSRVPTPGNLPSKAKKKMLMPRGQPWGGGGGWAQVELTDAFKKVFVSGIPHSTVQPTQISTTKILTSFILLSETGIAM